MAGSRGSGAHPPPTALSMVQHRGGRLCGSGSFSPEKKYDTAQKRSPPPPPNVCDRHILVAHIMTKPGAMPPDKIPKSPRLVGSSIFALDDVKKLVGRAQFQVVTHPSA